MLQFILDKPAFQVTALDKDEEDTANSWVTYSLTTQTPNLKEPRFSINPTSGLIVISGCLDHKVKYIIYYDIYLPCVNLGSYRNLWGRGRLTNINSLKDQHCSSDKIHFGN